MQTCPQFPNLPETANFTAYFKSASSKTTKGSEPPNSITDFFKYLPAVSEILDPALALPVKLIPLTKGDSASNSNYSYLVNTL